MTVHSRVMKTFSLLTFNCFGTPGIRTSARLGRLAQKLNQSSYSMVCLQEVQTNRYRSFLTSACGDQYPEQAYQPFIHAPKGGLMTLSQHPLVRQEFILFQKRGLWYTPAVTDWILHKGILVTETRVADLPIIILNTHLTANYTADWRSTNIFARQERREIEQVAAVVNAQPTDALVIVCGDFNIPRGTWLYDLLLSSTDLVDPMRGDTRPTFRPFRGMGSRYAVAIDYALYRAPSTLKPEIDSRLRFQGTERINGRDMHISDHVGIETRLSWQPPPN